LTPAIQPFVHHADSLSIKGTELYYVSTDAVVVKVSLQSRPQLLHKRCSSQTFTRSFDPLLYRLQGQPELLFGCPQSYDGFAFSAQVPPVFKAEKRKRLTFLRLEPGEPDDPGLQSGQLQFEFPQSPGDHVAESPQVFIVLKAADEIICKPHDERFAFDSRFDDFLKPQIKRVVQVDICLLYTSPSPRDRTRSRMPSSA